MLLYCHTNTSRFQYITNFISREIGVETVQITTDVDAFNHYQGPKINYSAQQIKADEFWIRPHALLFEKEIILQPIQCFEVNVQKAFFKTEGDFPFDIFAASFYLLSRYEEYLPHAKDIYGRYAHENSLAFRENFLQLPLINLWLESFKKALQEKFPSFTFHASSFTFLPTYDIDEAWSYKHKSWWRTLGATVKNLFKGDLSRIAERKQVLSGKQPDPFEAYEWMDRLHETYDLQPPYFFLVPKKTGKYDRNILPKEKSLQQLIQRHNEKYIVGVHPSWQSGDDPSLVKQEIKTIEEITGSTVDSSRQHFIRFHLPATYRHLINAGINKDFSMGYGSINGFRASVASVFYWYDLEKEETTSLLLHPFCFMEANSFFEQKFSPQQALEEMRHYYKVVRSVNGTLISIWHNTFLGTDKKFDGWREVYKQFIDLVRRSPSDH